MTRIINKTFWLTDNAFRFFKLVRLLGAKTRVHTEKGNHCFKDFSRTSFDFQEPPTRNVLSQIVQKCTFPVHSNRT